MGPMALEHQEDPRDGLADAFRLARRRFRLSQRELADALGWDRAVVGRWEAGEGPVALSRVDGVLRGLGFRLRVVPWDPTEWVDDDDVVDHIADRGLRRFPAHLDPRIVRTRPFHWWARYRDEDNPYAPLWTYEMRPADRRRAAERRPGPAPEPEQEPEAGPRPEVPQTPSDDAGSAGAGG